MPKVIKFAVKDLNPDLLHEELRTVGIQPDGVLYAGFDRISGRLSEPFTETRVRATSTGQPDVTAEPGELHFRYETDPGIALDAVLAAHDAKKLSKGQQNKDTDNAMIPILVDFFNNFETKTRAQKDDLLKQLARLVARRLDSKQDI